MTCGIYACCRCLGGRDSTDYLETESNIEMESETEMTELTGTSVSEVIPNRIDPSSQSDRLELLRSYPSSDIAPVPPPMGAHLNQSWEKVSFFLIPLS